MSSNTTFINHVLQYYKICAVGDLGTYSRTSDLGGIHLGKFVKNISATSYNLCLWPENCGVIKVSFVEVDCRL